LVKSLIAALACYSRLPVPKTEWDEQSARWMLCFLPVVGLVLALFCRLLFLLAETLQLGNVFGGALLAALPVLVTGGIHLDGFLDASDAIHSWKSREEKLKIMEDPHIGGFAVIAGLVLVLLYFGAFTEVDDQIIGVVAAGYVYSRCLSALGALRIPKAKKDGMLRDTTDSTDKRAAGIVAGEAAATALVMVLLSPLYGLAAVLSGVAVYLWYRQMVLKRFGGTTGDLAGYFLCLCELVMLLAVVLTEKVSVIL